MFEGVLLTLATKLELEESGTERVSIYVYRSDAENFVPCGRFSHNPILKSKGRAVLPANQGGIAKAWEQGWHFNNAFPEDVESKAYREYIRDEYGIPRSTVRGFKMKPRCLAAKKIQANDRPVAVIVAESTEAGVLVEQDLQNLLAGIADEYGRMVAAVDKHIPDPNLAAEVGL